MRALQSLLVCSMIVSGFAVACSSSSSPGSTADTGGSGADTSGDTNVGGDTNPGGDTKTDGRPDTKVVDTNPGTDTSPSTCDPVAQTGCTAPDTKCTAVDDGTGKSTMPGCVTPTGTKATGDTCSRTAQTPAGVGHDDCAAGFCSGIGQLHDPPSRKCRKFCAGDSTCGTGEKCSVLIADPSGAAIAGICVPTCTMFGTDCAGGDNCSVLISDFDGKTAYGTCRAVGKTAIDGTCTNPYDCVKDTICADPLSTGTATCISLCDDSHACPSGKTCKAYGSLPKNGGLCQ